MTQMLLLPDPRPLVERLGADFFRNVPVSAGVYLMRDAEGQVLYVGKAKNLRNRLRSYRVANPDRMPRRHLRLLRAATSIELQQCSDETAALARESELLLLLRPRYNRAGTWPGNPGFLLWRATPEGLELGLSAAPGSGCASYGPVGAGGFFLRAALVRLLWCVIWPERGLGGMPAGWFHGPQAETVLIARGSPHVDLLQEIQSRLTALFAGGGEEFGAWIRERASASVHPFESAVREADLESLSQFLKPKPAWRAKHPRMDTN